MTKNMNRKKAGIPPIFYFLLGLILVFVGPKLWGMLPFSGNSDWISFGDRIVIADNTTPEKQEAIAAFARGDRQKAE
jgi:branched-chain amino acid transport system substrate-binding protein